MQWQFWMRMVSGWSFLPRQSQRNFYSKKFVARLDDFERQIKDGTATVSMELLTFLKDWLIKHIAGTDPGYVPYLQGRSK
jgi:methyl-accepting chemotaxis protein